MFLPRSDSQEASPKAPSEGETESITVNTEEQPPPPADDAASARSLPAGIATDCSPEIGLVCVSGSADFEAVRGWCDTVSNVTLASLFSDSERCADTAVIVDAETCERWLVAEAHRRDHPR